MILEYFLQRKTVSLLHGYNHWNLCNSTATPLPFVDIPRTKSGYDLVMNSYSFESQCRYKNNQMMKNKKKQAKQHTAFRQLTEWCQMFQFLLH